jgi:hypothetical protein
MAVVIQPYKVQDADLRKINMCTVHCIFLYKV